MTWFDRLLLRLLRWRLDPRRGRVYTVRGYTTDPRRFPDLRLVGGVAVGFGDQSKADPFLVVEMTREQLDMWAESFPAILRRQDQQLALAKEDEGRR